MSSQSPFPDDFIFDEEYHETAIVAGVSLKGCGLVARHKSSQRPIWGSGLEYDGKSTAYYELLERMAILRCLVNDGAAVAVSLDAGGKPQNFVSLDEAIPSRRSSDHGSTQLSHSNGVALGENIQHACRSAMHETVERHVVLYAWANQLAPKRIIRTNRHNPLFPEYEVEHYAIASAIGHIALSLMIPQNAQNPLALGFGFETDLESAIYKSMQEAQQRIVFLWESPLPELVEDSTTPDFHQDFYLMPKNHKYLLSWLHGDDVISSIELPDLRKTRYFWLNPNFDDPYPVVRAEHPELEALYFGLDGDIPHPIA